MVSARRYAAVGALLVVGVLMTQTFAAATTLQTTSEATRVDPALVPHEVAQADAEVVDLDVWRRSDPDSVDAVLREAIQTGTYNGSLPPELHIEVADLSNRTRYAVYGGEYYRFDVVLHDEETTNATIRTAPANAQTVADDVATSYENASADARRVIDDGSVASDSFAVERGLYVRDRTYYLVRPANEGAIFGKFVALIGGFLFNPIGKAYAVSGFVLLGALRHSGRDRPLTAATAIAVVPGTVLFAWASAALVGSGSLAMRFVLVPAIGVVAAFGLFAGVCLRRQSWAKLAAGSVTLGGGVVAVGVAALGVLGAVFGIFGMVAGWFGSLVLALYGFVFAADAPTKETVEAAVTAPTADE
ncbi:hypothetical protein [Haloferax sp. YSMS24]|uniref:hypothetical protein n=1 Tax=Haloferax sp. YSMS24 TaxID=3388425 RepID=UPI00398D3793